MHPFTYFNTCLFALQVASLPQSCSASSSTSSANTTDGGSTSNNDTTGLGSTFQATITGYGGNCADSAAGYGSCGFLGAQNSYQGAVSTYWNTLGLPGQCGTCWKLTAATNINGDGSKGSLIGTTPIVVMIDNTCAKDASKPTGAQGGYQCNQDGKSCRISSFHLVSSDSNI